MALLESGPPKKLEQIGRIEQTSSSGIEIVETWYCEPYDSFRHVQRELTGSARVLPGASGFWLRKSPAQDAHNENCYCVETLVNFADPDAMASAESLSDKGRNNTLEQVRDVPVKLQKGVAGAVIRATYRPLITAWKESEEGQQDDTTERWDWIDPIIRPGVRQLPWPEGLFIGIDKVLAIPGFDTGFAPVPDDIAQPLGITVSDFSIRRMFVGAVPWDTIAAAGNAVNKGDWPLPQANAAKNLPQFKARTLKFINADILNMMDVDGRRWYELQYNFQWVQHRSDRIFDREGILDPDTQWVTWNHIFYRPGWNSVTTTGWYEVWKGEEREDLALRATTKLLPGLDIVGGRLHNEVEFQTLFERPQQ